MSNTPISDRAIHQYWPEFRTKCETRLEVGAREYGDISFQRPVSELLEEIEQELLDQANWSFIAYVRIQEMKRAISKGELLCGKHGLKV